VSHLNTRAIARYDHHISSTTDAMPYAGTVSAAGAPGHQPCGGGHAGPDRRDVDDVGDDEQRARGQSTTGRVAPAMTPAVQGCHHPQAGAHELNRRHQRNDRICRPECRYSERCARHEYVDPGRVVIARTRDQAGARRFLKKARVRFAVRAASSSGQEAAASKRPWTAHLEAQVQRPLMVA